MIRDHTELLSRIRAVHASIRDAIVMACGFLLVGYQLSGYFLAA